MCGIYGILALDSAQPGPGLEAMGTVLRHRGPDDQGSFQIGPIHLGFRRLSIIDLAGGHQPMSNEDGTIWLVFNGEIYNHPELRTALEERGHTYTTNSDSETILHLYEEFGDDCVHHLRGMFAFALWDICRKRLFCARDRLGVKPFYYAMAGRRFVFASEMKALFEIPGFNAQLNRRALPEFFALGYLSSPETLFEGVYKLPPGHRLHINLQQPSHEPQVEQYWDLEFPAAQSDMELKDCVEQFHELLVESVRIHLRSDVPFGVFLSGGIDSSSIAAITASLCRHRVETFSVGYAEEGYSELPYARRVAEYIGAVHHQVILDAETFFASLPRLIWHEDEPLVWPSSVALFHVANLARSKVKVVLSGEGADEIMAGYLKYRITLWNLGFGPWYRRLTPSMFQRFMHRFLKSDFMPDAIARKLRHSFLYYPNAFEQIHVDNFYAVFPGSEQPELFTPQTKDELIGISPYKNSRDFCPGDPAAIGLNHLLYFDIKTYLVELLMKQDQMSMASSIESRVPFLDHSLVEFAANVPERHKLHGWSGKYLIRKAMANRLPAEVVRRNKKGFPTPVRPWLRAPLFEKLSRILTDGRLDERGIVQAEYVRRLLKSHRAGHASATERCWRLLNFELWNRIFLDRDNVLISVPPPEAPTIMAQA